MYIPATKVFGGKKYKLYNSLNMMNKAKANTTAAQLRKEGYLARTASFMSDNQAEYLCYYREK